MSRHDPIADFCTRIRNASKAGHRFVDVNFSILAENIAQVLKDKKFIEHYLVKKENGQGTIRLFLRYEGARRPLIRGIDKVSNPGRRIYVGYEEIPSVFNDLGLSVVSTSQGVLAGHDARKKKVGGELLIRVW